MHGLYCSAHWQENAQNCGVIQSELPGLEVADEVLLAEVQQEESLLLGTSRPTEGNCSQAECVGAVPQGAHDRHLRVHICHCLRVSAALHGRTHYAFCILFHVQETQGWNNCQRTSAAYKVLAGTSQALLR